MAYTKIKLTKCPKSVEIDVYFTETEVEIPIGENGVEHDIDVEIEEVNYDGDILTIFAWYKYNDLIDEITNHIKKK